MERLIKKYLTGIFDYAGLFPPAALSLENAMEEYIRYRHSEYDWLLSHFVITHTKLEDLYDLSAREPELPDPLRLSITAAPTKTVKEFLDQLEKIEDNIIQLHKSLRIKLKTDVLEIKLPDEIHHMETEEDILPLLDAAVSKFGENHLLPECIFFEVPGFNFSKDIALKAIQALKIQNEKLKQNEYEFYNHSGFKIRCGGVEAFHFPPAEYVAFLISTAASLEIPLKYTAGLHHPYRRYHDSVKTEMHGFINVLGASFLSAAHQLTEQQLTEMLLDEDPANFSFSDDIFEWKGHQIALKEIRDLRRDQVTTIGSCSIAEPVEDLQKLKLIL